MMRKDSSLAQHSCIHFCNLMDIPLILSRQEERDGWPILSWLGVDIESVDAAATYTLIYNASLLVEEGVGYAVCFDKLYNTAGTGLCFRPSVVWKK